MQEVKKKPCSHCQELKKERHIVTWSQQEDDILRQQIKLHGTENWSIIASKFEDKTTRQCRRRWYTYLNLISRKGVGRLRKIGSCAQKIFGNRWTEIARMVSGRTDNAVKNRFSTLCKKKAKNEASVAKENNIYCINSNNKRVSTQTEFIADGSSETGFSINKIRRTHKLDIKENCNVSDGLHKHEETTMDQQPGAPFAVLIENIHTVNGLPTQNTLINAEKILNDDQSNKIKEAFLNKNDLEISAFVQPAELLSSLVRKVQTENSNQSIENAWKVLKECLINSKTNEILKHKVLYFDLGLEDIKDFVKGLRSGNGENHRRQPDLHESPGSLECRKGSNLLFQTAEEQINIESTQTEEDPLYQDISTGSESTKIGEYSNVDGCEKGTSFGANAKQGEVLQLCDKQTNKDAVISSPSTEFNSPIQVIPLFRSLAAGIPSPVFSESERNFLLKTFGLESPSPYPPSNTSQPPSCKRVLLHSL